MNNSVLKAYANGALDGYNTGTDNNPYDSQEKPQENQAYKLGYDYGVAMYCQDMEGQEA